MNKTALFKVFEHTPGTLKCHEIDGAGEKTKELIGQLYVQKAAFGALPIGTTFTVTVGTNEVKG